MTRYADLEPDDSAAHGIGWPVEQHPFEVFFAVKAKLTRLAAQRDHHSGD